LNSVEASRPVPKARQSAGLGFWMERVLEECDRAREDFAADPVHDLRVAMRRCRSMADGLMLIDPDKSWKKMKKAAKPLFQALGELRDTQVMEELVQKFGAADDPAVRCILDYAKLREHDLKSKAMTALDEFDRKAWRSWAKRLPRRAARIRMGSAVFRHMALERWTEARELQRQALRNRSQIGLHRLRIGIKRLRYTVENFLPELHELWIEELKDLQDQLGEVHDLDVLWAKMVELGAFPDVEARTRWREIMAQARNKRIDKYREKMVGNRSLWMVWRAELPQGQEIRKAGLERLRIWASFLDPDTRHTRHIARLALALYDGLAAGGLGPPLTMEHGREIMQAAAFLHDAGRAKREKGHHKTSGRWIDKLAPPLGWSAEELKVVAAVARFHRGALPQARHREISLLNPEQRKIAIHLSAILRLANGLDWDRSGTIREIRVQPQDGFVAVYAKGYSPRIPMAERIAAARHLLEVVYRCPVTVKPWK
jgi:CHAD domain-containing protein